MKINQEIFEVLIKIDFVDRFLNICNSTNSRHYGFRPRISEL